MKKTIVFLLISILIFSCAYSTTTNAKTNSHGSKITSRNKPNTNSGATNASGKPACQFSGKTGYRIVNLDGVKAAAWYPTAENEALFDYSNDFSTNLAKDAQPIQGCGRFPLIVFSHGYGGCGTQTIFFTEALARAGYVVVAPDHRDALCRVDGSIGDLASTAKEPSLFAPAKWNDTSYIERRNDIEKVIDGMIRHKDIGAIIDRDRIGAAGHSLGGYAILGMAGGWESWRDDRIKAVLLFSPYSLVYSSNNRLSAVKAPIMYQGADFDLGITPFLEGKDGAYAKSNPPKYFVKFRAGNHFIWTDLQCLGHKMTSDCLNANFEAKMIDYYGISFFEAHLKGRNQTLLSGPGLGLSAYNFQVLK